MEASDSDLKGIGPNGHNLRWYHYAGDFVNMLKAFIGTNYQGLAFAFTRSGLVLGFFGVALVASLTDHCIQMLVRCKADIIRKACEKEFATGQYNVRELTKFRKRLEQTIGFADISHRVLGNGFYHLTQFAVWFTQFSTIVAYFVVMGNTISALYPSQPATNQTTANYTAAYTAEWTVTTESSKFFNNVDKNKTTTTAPTTTVISTTTHFTTSNLTTADGNSTNVTTTTPYYVSTTTHPHAFELSADMLLIICIAIPLPFLLVTSLIRRVRLLAPFSTIAAVALAIGATAVLGLILHEFTVTANYALWRIFTFPLFFAQLTANFEGIGCLLPIHSSMEGNRHLFSCYLHTNVFIVFCVLCTYGSLGYLRYGDNVNQLIIMMVSEQSSLLVSVVDVTIIISVLFTYPLQCFPVIEIAESYIFGEGRCCGPRHVPRRAAKSDLGVEDGGRIIDNSPDERSALLDSQSSVRSIEASVSETAVVISEQVPTWKRNILRILLTLFTAICAVISRNSFAYINAFSGAIAASLLSFIIPCLVHLRLYFSDLPWYVKAKDIFIVCLSVVFSVLALVLIALNVAHGEVL